MHYESLKPIEAKVFRDAVDILNEYGWDIFDKHCNENDMSYCDMNRCIAKCKVLYNRPDLHERPIPDNLKQARWEHYTKVCRYDKNHAIELLKRIDQSHKRGNDAG